MSLLEVNKITPQSGTTLTLGDSGDSVAFASGAFPDLANLTVTGDLTVDTNSLKVDSTNNHVGIGTASPSCSLHIVDSSTASQIIIENTDAGASAAPDVFLYRNSASPADNDVLGHIEFRGKNSAGEETRYAVHNAKIIDVTDGTEDGQLEWQILNNGGFAKILTMNPTELVVNEDSQDTNFRVESDNSANALFVEGSSGKVGIGTTTIPEVLTANQSSNGAITGLSINNDYPTSSTASAGTGSGIRFGVNDGSFTSAFGDARGSEILSVTRATNGRSRDIVFKTDNSGSLGEVMRILHSGNVGIKNSSPSHTLDISDNTTTAKTLRVGQSSGTSTVDATVIIGNGGNGDAMLRFDYEGSDTDRARLGVTGSGQILRFYTAGDNERMCIDNTGNVGIGTSNPGKLLEVQGPSDETTSVFLVENNNSSSYNSVVSEIRGGRASTNASYYLFSAANGNSSGIFRILDSGNAQNTNNSYGGTSDLKLKENIIDANAQWEDIKALSIKKYSFKLEESDTATQIGVIAQDLETAGMNGLVEETVDRDENGNDLGTTTKSVKYSVLYMKAVKALQEAITKIEELETRIATLENA